MIGVVQTAGVGKVGAGTAVHGGGFVHQVGEFRFIAGDQLGDQLRAVIAGTDHGGVEQIQKIDGLPHLQTGGGAALLHLRRTFSHGDLL